MTAEVREMTAMAEVRDYRRFFGDFFVISE